MGPEVLYTAHELTDVVGPGLTRALEDMRDAAIAAEDNTKDRGLWNSTIALCRELERDPQAGARLRGLHVKRNEPSWRCWRRWNSSWRACRSG